MIALQTACRMNLYEIAKARGIQTEYLDGQGRRRVTDEAALKIVLEALPPQTPGTLIGAPVVIRAGKSARATLLPSAKLPATWKITSGQKVIAKDVAPGRVIVLPEVLAEGIYRLEVTDSASTTEDVPLIVAPARAFAGDFDRCWLLAVQLYSIRSRRNWGIGDFTDLQGLVELAHRLGADGVGLNPLHALFDDRPGDCSPYSPNSRLFLNALYIDVEKLPGFKLDPETKAALARLRALDVVDYAAVAGLKWQALRAGFAAFKGHATPAELQDFDKFRGERGALLARFACFEALRREFAGPWWEWPPEWRQPDDAACADLRNGARGSEIEFVEFVQWAADRQLGAASDLAKKLGMKVGLYLDVAVGVQSDGFDAWNEQIAISRHLGVGAPPDSLNTAGQSWGLAGFNASGLEQQNFAPFAEMLRAAMRHAGAIRLDHVLGLKRLYLVPHGFSPADGVYVQMPFEALLAVTAQESVANRCVVIGEDLGTVPEGFREQMADWGIWSYLVMMFERDDAGAFRGVGHYWTNALITFNTHDLSTYAGWRGFHDLKVKRALGIDPGESDDARWHALAMLDDVLRHHEISGHDLYSVARFLARTPSRLLAISLEDLLMIIDQPNIPGTVHEHPNWRQRISVSLEQIASAIDVDALRAATRERSGVPADR
jgi:4-alpha-glucanotransferase